MGVLNGGAFLIAFAVALGASNFVIGLLAAIGPLSQLLQLPSIFLVEKIRNRRLITVVAAGLSRICWLINALSPFIFPSRIAIAVLLVLLIAVSAFGAVSGCSWNSWMRDIIPEKIMGSFFSKRMRIATGAGIFLSISAAVYLSSNTIANSIAAGIAPILGGTFADFFAGRQLDWTLRYTSPGGEFVLPTLNFQQWDFFFAFAFLIGLYALHRLAMVKEEGEVEEKIVAQALFTEVRTQVKTLSSVEGVKQMISFPITMVRSFTELIISNENKGKD
jgi:hypothetical protein